MILNDLKRRHCVQDLGLVEPKTNILMQTSFGFRILVLLAIIFDNLWYKGSHPSPIVQFFFNIVQTAFDPPSAP